MRLIDHRTDLEVMDRRACLGLLGSHRVGRVAVVSGGRPLIFPVNYVMDDGTVLFRTDPGTKLSGAHSQYYMSFEIDGIDEHSHEGWSVVVNGVGREVVEPNELARVQALPLMPWSPGDKQHWIRIRPETVTGRRITRRG
jgi:uncharacterized protein